MQALLPQVKCMLSGLYTFLQLDTLCSAVTWLPAEYPVLQRGQGKGALGGSSCPDELISTAVLGSENSRTV